MNAVDSLDLSSLIPHRGESILLDRVVGHDGKSTTVSIIVGSQSWLLREDGTVAPWLGIEYMAQSVAAHEGILARKNGLSPPLGFLVSVVAWKLLDSRLICGERLEVQTTRVRGRPELGALSHRSSLYRNGAGGQRELVATGRLSFSIPKARAG